MGNVWTSQAIITVAALRLALHILASMSNAPQIAEVAALVGDRARANMLVALLGGLSKLSAARLILLMKLLRSTGKDRRAGRVWPPDLLRSRTKHRR
jgi:hypothetical protein